MEGCFVFLAFVVAVVALVIAVTARQEVRELKKIIAGGRWPVARASAPEAPPQPAARPAEPEPVAVVPPAPPPPPATPPRPAPAAAKAWTIDWENLVGIKLFSWIAGIALVLAAVFLFKYSVEHGWLRPAVRAAFGFITGIGLLIVCELRVARNYRFTANAMDGAGIAILYATLFALHGRWHLWPAAAAFFGMLLVTAAAVFLSTRRDSIFIALLGLLGGFATPALLSSGENRPIALFSYLLLLNGGISWIAYRKRWSLLTALSVALTAIYQWTWIEKFLTTGQLPLAAGIFVVFALVAATAFWPRETGGRDAFRRIAAAGAVLPLLFAFFTAVVPEYGARYNVLFGFLMLVAAGLAAIAMWRGPEWLHLLGGAAALVTFFLWLTVSYVHASWPWSVAWLGGFVALYLLVGTRLKTIAVYTAPLLFFVFLGLAFRAPARFMTLTGAMFALLAIVVVYALWQSKPYLAAIALAFASMTVIALDRAPFWLLVVAQAILFTTLFVIAWISERHWLALGALPLMIGVLLASERHDAMEQLIAGVAVYALFLLYPLSLGARVKRSIAPHLAAALAGLLFFIHAYDLRNDLGFAEYAGFLPIAQAVVMLLLLWRLLPLEPYPARLALVAATVLAFLTAAVPVQLEKEWITIGWALEAAALAWLFTRIPHRGILVWCAGLMVFVFARLAFNPSVFDYHPKSATPVFNWYLYTYLVCAIAMFIIARLAPASETMLRRVASAAGTIELFVLLNIEIADYYSSGEALTFNFMGSSLAQDLTYTIAWAIFAITVLIAGIALHSRAARVAALGLLLITILKCFLHDLARLGGLYRVASLFGLAVSLVLVGLMLQKFVMMKRGTPAA
jgi:uncharacterized membrane protein